MDNTNNEILYSSVEEQIEKLKQQNLIIEDEDFAKKYLEIFGYFNLIKGYRSPYIFTDASGLHYRSGITFNQILSLYMFDKNLRNAVIASMLDLEEHIKKYIDTVSTVVNGEPHQQLLTTFLGKMIDLYSVLCYHFSDAMAEVDRVAEDEGLKQSLRRYAIESGAITERVYHKEMEAPIEDMKRFLDGILHIYDEGRTAVKMGDLFGIVAEAEARLAEKE